MNRKLIGLSLDITMKSRRARNHSPTTWPPQPDFPVIISENGTPTCVYADSIWDLTPWAERKETINFGDGPLRKNVARISPENAALLRLLIAMWLYCTDGVRTVNTLTLRFDAMRRIMVLLSEKEIQANNFECRSKVIEELATSIRPCHNNTTIFLFHDIWENRDFLGFHILNPEEIMMFSNCCARHDAKQTPYIPPRIWSYQIRRLKCFIDDFLKNSELIISCFNYMLEAYKKNGLDAGNQRLKPHHRPFHISHPRKNTRNGIITHGHFKKTLEKFNILELMEAWLEDVDLRGAKVIGNYFNLASLVGCAYIANFSMMRSGEIRSLRTGCFKLEYDEKLGLDIPTIRGRTTKTLTDNNACWITSASSESAIKMLEIISRLRTSAALLLNEEVLTSEDIEHPYLLMRPSEPWRLKQEYASLPPAARPTLPAYSSVPTRYPKLFDLEQLRIRSGDLDLAKLVTPSLDPELFSINSIWPLAWHQLRRTGAVNMNASGLVSEPSLQYELKHTCPWMSRYYGQGFHHVHLEITDEVKSTYVKAMYEAIAIQFKQLESSRYISLHGEKRKSQIIDAIKSASHNEIIHAVEIGTISCRNILMGFCTSLTPCPYGGIDYVAKCAGTDTKHSCENLLIDKEKRPLIENLSTILKARLTDSDSKSPLRNSLEMQLTSVKVYLDASK
ncbi:hypothetical protein D3C76_295130 [compost metagenome]